MHRSDQIRVPATYMRGGTSKGLFFRLQDLPIECQQPGRARDAFLMRAMGSPDPYQTQIDGMGGATSSTSKCVIMSRSARLDHDVEYLYGQVSIDCPLIDWSGNCGNLTAAAGAYAIHAGLIDNLRIPEHGLCTVRIWQANINKTILAKVPVKHGHVQETGDFELAGVAFQGAEIALEFIDPTDNTSASLFPTGHTIEALEVPGVGRFRSTMINAGIPTVFVHANDLGYTGTELRQDINNNPQALAMLEKIRVAGALRMGLIETPEDALYRQHTPKIVFVGPPVSYAGADGKLIAKDDIDLVARGLSMGKLHHAMMGTVSVAIAAAAAVPGTLISDITEHTFDQPIRFGHPSGIMVVGAQTKCDNGKWTITKVSMSRSARIIMQGEVFIPG